MTANFIPLGEPAHDAERQALRYLVDGLPDNYTVYGNAWLVERTGVVYELDSVVAAPHAIYVVEVKSYRGRIDGTDHDWYVPHPIPSPLKKNRLCAQILKTQLKREHHQAGQVWVEGLVFLSATTDCGVRGRASDDRLHTRKSILTALQDPALIQRLSGRRPLADTTVAERELLRLLTGTRAGRKPPRRVREYEIVETLGHHDSYTELLGRNSLSGAARVLRVYGIPPLATDAQRERITARARWESQVLGRLGRSDGILSADPPFEDEAGIVLPLEHFEGITLGTWLSKYGPELKGQGKGRQKGREKADLEARTDLWLRIAATLDRAHRQGVVHRLLRPEVVLVQDSTKPTAIRVTGFDLAKQLSADTTVSLTLLADERLVYAAPEVVMAFSSAEPASDQFSLGVLLALLLTGRAPFESSRALLGERRLLQRVRDQDPRLPLSLDEAVTRMLGQRPTGRFPSLAHAIEAVRIGRNPARAQAALPNLEQPPLDADNLPAGTRIGPDYEVLAHLGQGGMAVVYAARHLVSGRTRALKIANMEDAAEDALREEYQALSRLDHPNIVKVIDLTKMIEGRLTLVMERVGGETLQHWQQAHPDADAATRRRLAEDLLAGLDYLEQQDITHKDLKPDNLLVGDGRLTIIDFSLVGIPVDAPYGGTAMYRDPAGAVWSHATDRFAAALCLFELYAGRHAFDGRVPEPEQPPSVRQDDVEPPGLAAFFRKALHPAPERRFPSARAMREAFLVALGEEPPNQPGLQPGAQPGMRPAAALHATTPVHQSGLSQRAINALIRARIPTLGDLLTLSPQQVRGLHAIGTKTAAEVIAFQNALREGGLSAAPETTARLEAPLVPELVHSPEPLACLPLAQGVLGALTSVDLPTIGALASLTRSQLLDLPGIGRKRLAEVVEALHQFQPRYAEIGAEIGAENGAESGGARTLDRIWDLAATPLTERQRIAVERVIGILADPEPQGDIAQDLRTSQAQISNDCASALTRLDLAALANLLTSLDAALEGFGGVVRLDELGRRFEEEWPAGLVMGAGIIRLLVRLSSARAQLLDIDGVDSPVVARADFDRATLRAFTAEVERLADQWPPVEPDSVRRSLAVLLPHFEQDHLVLAAQLCDAVDSTDSGHLFIGPVDAKPAIAFVLEQARKPIALDDLEAVVRGTFGHAARYPDQDHLLAILGELDCRVQGNQIIPGTSASVQAAPAPAADPLPSVPGAAGLGQQRSPEAAIRAMLQEAADNRGFRMLVTPPEQHPEIGRSVAEALGAHWVSFDNAFFADHGADLAALERAERFIAQRSTLTEAAEDTLFRLLDDHGQPGNRIVLGDTALLGTCEALDLPRRLYDETLSGSRGFWVLVVPGVIHNRQPLFNEGVPMWHLQGNTLPLQRPLPPEAHI